MAAVRTQTGEVGSVESEEIFLSKHEWSLGPAKPLLRALGVGFAVGLVTMAVLAFVQ